jgi:HK97 family phage major capsid protein
MSEEIKGLIEAQGRAFEAFKEANDKRFAQELKGAVDVVVGEKVDRINGALDDLAAKLKEVEVKAARPGAGASDADQVDAAHRAGYRNWMAKGDETGLAELERKSLQTGVNADGGFAVPKVIDTAIVKKLIDISPVRQVAQVITIGTSDYNKIADVGGISSGWVAETAARSETNTPQLANIKPTMGELYANPFATQVMLDDAFFDAEAWLAGEIATEFARAEGAAFISGNGTNRPTGFITGTPVATADSSRAWGVLQYVATAQAAALPAANTYGDIYLDLVYSLKAGYRQGAVWMAAKAMIGSLRKIKDGDNNYLWQVGLAAGEPGTFAGYPVIEAEDMPAVAAGTFPLAFGNFGQGYLIVDRMGTRTIRDPFSNKPYIGFYTTKRVGGIVQNSEAIKLLKVAAS